MFIFGIIFERIFAKVLKDVKGEILWKDMPRDCIFSQCFPLFPLMSISQHYLIHIKKNNNC